MPEPLESGRGVARPPAKVRLLALLFILNAVCGCAVTEGPLLDGSDEGVEYEAVAPPPLWPEEAPVTPPAPESVPQPEPAASPPPTAEEQPRAPEPPRPPQPAEPEHEKPAPATFAGPLPWRSWVRTSIYGRYRPLSSLFKSKRRKANGRVYYHQGVDILAPRGTPLVAPADGRVVRAGNWDPSGYGNAVLIRVRAGSRTLYVLYAHLDRVLVKKGQAVRRSRHVGTAGITGNARRMPTKEEHVHVEIRTIEKVGRGLKGRVDPLLYFTNVVPPKELRADRSR